MTKNELFHMSKTRLPIGTILECRGFPFVEIKVEEILSNVRPNNCIGRESSIFMSASRDACKKGLIFDEGYLHVVEPIGRVEKRDINWIKELQLRHHRNSIFHKKVDPALKNISDEEIANRYWQGISSAVAEWEYVSAAARVIELVSESPITIHPKLI